MKIQIKKGGVEINIEIAGKTRTSNNNDGDYDIIAYQKDKVIELIRASTVSICTIINEMKRNPITDISEAEIISDNKI